MDTLAVPRDLCDRKAMKETVAHLQEHFFLLGIKKGRNILVDWIKPIHLYLWALGFTEQEEVTGLFSKDCILPCHFPPGHDEVIHWSKENKKVPITTSRRISWKNKIHVTEQTFSRRTSLVEMPHWNLVTWPWLRRALTPARWEQHKVK